MENSKVGMSHWVRWASFVGSVEKIGVMQKTLVSFLGRELSSRRAPGGRQWQPTPVFLPGESHGQRSLAGYSLWGCKELDKTEATAPTRHGFIIFLAILTQMIPFFISGLAGGVPLDLESRELLLQRTLITGQQLLHFIGTAISIQRQ